jgi:hypothetical protein
MDGWMDGWMDGGKKEKKRGIHSWLANLFSANDLHAEHKTPLS